MSSATAACSSGPAIRRRTRRRSSRCRTPLRAMQHSDAGQPFRHRRPVPPRVGPPPAEMIGRTFAHYRIVEQPRGGMGEVYARAHDTHLDRDVAIKVLPPAPWTTRARRRFRREAEALSRLNHAHIATVHDLRQRRRRGFPGDGVRRRRDAFAADRFRAALRTRRSSRIAATSRPPSKEAHERGIVHRDLKPANIVVTPRAG